MNSQEMSFKSITFVWACLQTCITKCRKFHGSTVSFPVWLNVKKANFNTMLSDDKRPKNHIIKSTVITFGYNKLQYFAFHVFAKMILGTWHMQIKSISNLNKLTHFFSSLLLTCHFACISLFLASFTAQCVLFRGNLSHVPWDSEKRKKCSWHFVK